MSPAGKFLTTVGFGLLALIIAGEAVLSPGGPGPSFVQRLQTGKERQKPASIQSESWLTDASPITDELPNREAASLTTEPILMSVPTARPEPMVRKDDDRVSKRVEKPPSAAGLRDRSPSRKRAKSEAASRRQDKIYYRYHAPIAAQAHQPSSFPFLR